MPSRRRRTDPARLTRRCLRSPNGSQTVPREAYTTLIRSVRDVAPEVREVVLRAPEEPLDYKPGQWISLHLPVGERPPLVRAYSLAAAPRPSGELVLCLDRVPDGLGSGYLFSLRPGDEITYAGPLGNFQAPETDADQLWLARYTGIVPFRAMLDRLRDQPPAGRVTLAYSAASPHHLAYDGEFRQAAAELSWFDLVLAVDEPAPEWTGRAGLLLDLLPELVDERADLVPMVCGVRSFVRPIRDWFYDRGYDRRAVKWENYD
jgi:NAD(P)H-flavin reductase